jgi:hypothetical protein
MPSDIAPHKVIGFQQLASLGSSTALTVPAGARVAYISAEAQVVRFRDDGTAPTAAIGHRLLLTAGPFLYQGDLNAVRFIEEAGGGKINVSYLS